MVDIIKSCKKYKQNFKKIVFLIHASKISVFSAPKIPNFWKFSVPVKSGAPCLLYNAASGFSLGTTKVNNLALTDGSTVPKTKFVNLQIIS